jgi:peptidoglycan/xylan/chitin deacetylase (PgdA/CDA1 family)
VPATFFVTTDRLNDRAYQYWWDVLEECLLVGRGPERLDIELPDGARSFDAATDEQRRAAHSAIYQEIVAAPAIARDRVIERLTAWSGRGIPAAPERRRMTADEVRDLAARDGHAIGAHTVRHLMLPRQPADSRRREIDDSRRCLEALLGRPVTTFAYPFGAVCDDTAAAVKEFSFAGAVTCEEKLSAAGVDVFRLPRFEVTPARAADFSSWLQSLFEQR